MGAGERRLFMLLGHVGLAARAPVFALVGYFLPRTAIDVNANKAVGVDGALARLHHQPLGPLLLGLVTAGCSPPAVHVRRILAAGSAIPPALETACA
jgi:hypothetical protein